MFDETQISLAARVVAFVMESQGYAESARLAGALERVGAVFRSSGNKTAIETSDRLLRWAEKCRAGNVPKTKCVNALSDLFAEVDATGFVGAPAEDWLAVRRSLEGAEARELKRTGDHARYLRLLRRGSAIEDGLAVLWAESGTYAGAEVALNDAIVQDQLLDNHMESSGISVMTMHQLKGREYDAVLLVEDRHRTFRGREFRPPFMDTRRLLQVPLTRARHFAYMVSERGYSTLDLIMTD
jgi:DNA helicase-2/ATP-dependent DNA helicase PcrA